MLVCCDNEGCIVDAKGQRFDLPALHDLAADIAAYPGAFTICTGRAVPYVEAMVQVLDLVDAATPCVCEGGGVLYTPCDDRYEAIAGRVDYDAIRALLPVGSYREEPGKVACYTAYPEPGYTVERPICSRHRGAAARGGGQPVDRVGGRDARGSRQDVRCWRTPRSDRLGLA